MNIINLKKMLNIKYKSIIEIILKDNNNLIYKI